MCLLDQDNKTQFDYLHQEYHSDISGDSVKK